MSKLKLAIIIGSTRDARFADIPANWILEKAQADGRFDAELVDLKDFDLPLFNEVASNAWAPSQDPAAVAWQQKIGEFDAYLFITAEYNRSITGALKNALDQAYVEWVKKPMAAFGYGGTGAARAVEHLRTIAIELQMVPVRNAIHLLGGDFFRVHPMGGQNTPMSEIEGNLAGSVKATFDDLAWWGAATKAARG